MLDALGARSAISAVVSSGDVDRAKPDPGIVTKALDESGADPRRTVMVGDTVWDVLAAERAGIGCIGLLCGGIAEEQLRAAGAGSGVSPTPPHCSATFTPARSASSCAARLRAGTRP